MSVRSLFASTFVAIACLLLATSARAQCLSWEGGFNYIPPGVQVSGGHTGTIDAMLVFDDGSGPALYASGAFINAGDVPASNIVKWDGAHWHPVAQGVQGEVRCMAVFDDGSGPALFVARATVSNHAQLAKWNGQVWADISGDIDFPVYALAQFNDGSGPALYAAGAFTHIDGNAFGHIARWNGSSWSSVGGLTLGSLSALQVFDDGSGAVLVAAGSFSSIDGVSANNIAQWNGSSWSALGAGVGAYPSSLGAIDDGTGPTLYVGGSFTSAGGHPSNGAARWNGTSWTSLGNPGFDFIIHQFTLFDDGSGPAVYGVGDNEGTSFPVVKKWNGSGWAAVGGTFYLQFTYYGQGSALVSFDDGNGPRLFVGGWFSVYAGQSILSIARWDGATWNALRPPGGSGCESVVHALATFDAGTGPKLYAGGEMVEAGGASTTGIAAWNGSVWSPLGTGLFQNNPPQFDGPGIGRALTVFDGPVGPPVLYVGGSFNDPSYGIATWNGTSWTGIIGVTILPGQSGTVYAFAVDDMTSPNALFVGGGFNSAGSVSAPNIARYDPHTNTWSALGSGANSPVFALATFDDGSGRALYAAGSFTTVGGIPAQRVARWNGSSWSTVGSGFDNNVLALKVFDDGSGSALYAGGGFTTAGGNSAPGIARWNGASWSAVGNGLSSGVVFALSSYDDGTGPALYATGGFTSSGATATSSIAKWNGQSWKPLGDGLNGLGYAMTTFDDGHGTSGPELFVGGDFTKAGANASSYIAAWRRCGTPFDTFCFGDGTLELCPCGNQGLPNHGCENSAATGGARLFATGTTQPDTLVLHAAGELPNALSIFLQGNALITAPVAFGDGLRCVGGSLKRLYVKNASGGAVAAPQGADLSITAQSAALGDPIAPGSTRYYQTYYRDPNLAFCAAPQGDAWNVTSGVIVEW